MVVVGGAERVCVAVSTRTETSRVEANPSRVKSVSSVGAGAVAVAKRAGPLSRCESCRRGACTLPRSAMEWTRDKTLELLREYEQRRVLWDWNARGYRDRAKRKRAIQELAEILRCNTLEIEKKITNLKCQYSREVHKIQNSREAATGLDDVYVSKWFAFKAMQFLQFGSRRYSKRKKKSEEEEEEDDEEAVPQEREYLVSDIDPECITFIDSNEEITNGSGNGSLTASFSEYAEESSSSSPKDTYEHIEGPGSARGVVRRKTRDEFVKFGESIALQLAEIPDSYSRSVAKLRINQILFEAEIGVYAQTRR